MLNFTGRAKLPLIRQTEASECGLACVAMVACYHGWHTDLNTLRRRYPISLKGAKLRDLMQLAAQLKLTCRPLRVELEQLGQLHLPAILHWDMNHFVVLKSVTRRGVVIHDPANGEAQLTFAEASPHLTGVALELRPAEEFCVADDRARLPFKTFWGRISGSAHAMLQILALSFVLEVILLAAPFYMQMTVDEVIARGDLDLLTVLALGFALLTLIKIVTTALRSFIVIILQNTLSFQIGARLFRHLIRLPMSFFEKRHVGDVLSRFGSIEPIRNMIAEGMILGLIDGLMAVLTLVMVFVYSIPLGMIACFAFLLYAVLRISLFRVLWRRNDEVIQSKAQENSTFIESLRAVQSLKLLNAENEREGQWLNRYAGFVNANVRLGRAQIAFKTVNDAIFGFETIVSIYVAARLALDNVLTVGMIIAFMSYKQQFIERAVMLVEKVLDYRLLGLHLERLSDIALTPVEAGHERPLSYSPVVQGAIELRNVSFRYAETEPFVLENINLSINPGQFVTIMGPSGSGKTTLMKIIVGLLEPSAGDVFVDGSPISSVGQRVYREHIGAVMQEDQLLSGSIADNICCFEPDFDEQHMKHCTQVAGIHEEIMRMPMTYNTLIGDMGSSLSSGQKQRVLLARALYRRPKILCLDEGTAHLDVEKEREINTNLRGLMMTRVSVAHRPDITTGADNVFQMVKPLLQATLSDRGS
jgi:ATP-binding cassette subfamily B protein RaxB